MAVESLFLACVFYQPGEQNLPKRRHSEEQIIYALKRVESGVKGLEVCREMGISEQTLYVWKRKYAGMGVGELRRLKQLEEENQEVLSKKQRAGAIKQPELHVEIRRNIVRCDGEGGGSDFPGLGISADGCAVDLHGARAGEEVAGGRSAIDV